MTTSEDDNRERQPAISHSDAVTATDGNDAASDSRNKDDPPKRIDVLRGTVLGICLAVLVFLQATNYSMITTISSQIAADLDAYSQVSWMTSSYLIAQSSITPIGGKLCQIFSTGSCILVACFMFSAGTIITALSPSFAWFMVGRAVSGAGAALIFSVGIVIVINLASEKRRGLFIGLFNSGFTVGVSSGAVIAGALAGIGWRWVFWLQIPLCLPAGLGIYMLVPPAESDHDNVGQTLIGGLKRIDYLGVVSMTTFVVLLLYSLSTSTINYWTLIASAVLLVIFLVVEARVAKEPVIPMEVMKSSAVALTCLSSLGFMTSRWTVLFYTPIYSIAVRGWSPAVAGTILIPTNAGFATGGLLVGLVHIRKAQSYYAPTLVVYLLFAVCMFVFSQISTTKPPAVAYIVTTFINGCLAGASLNYSYQHVLHRSKPKLHPIVTSLTAMVRGFAGSFGSSIGGGLFGRVLQTHLETGFEGQEFPGKDKLIKQLLGSPLLAQKLGGEQREVAKESYAAATSALFLAACIFASMAAAVQAGTGRTAVDESDEDFGSLDRRPLLENEE